MRATVLIMAGYVLLGACGGEQAAEEVPGNAVAVATPTAPVAVTPIVASTDAWIGKWVGVEGLALDVAAGDEPGTYRLHIALMDGAKDYAGTADGDVIRFTRDGKPETIRHTSGAETGLKWLAKKIDCLTIKPGEGFCRD
jgi:hypothetical protein